MPRAFITLILLIGTVILGWFYLRPEWKYFQELRSSNERLEQLSAEFDELIKNRDTLVDLINSVSKNDLDRIDKALPKGSQAGEILVMLENLVGKNDLSLQSIGLSAGAEQFSKTAVGPKLGSVSPLAPQIQPESIKDFPVDLSVAGSYESLKKFLAEIESNLRVTDAASLSFGGMNKPEEKVNFSLRVKMYYQ